MTRSRSTTFAAPYGVLGTPDAGLARRRAPPRAAETMFRPGSGNIEVLDPRSPGSRCRVKARLEQARARPCFCPTHARGGKARRGRSDRRARQPRRTRHALGLRGQCGRALQSIAAAMHVTRAVGLERGARMCGSALGVVLLLAAIGLAPSASWASSTWRMARWDARRLRLHGPERHPHQLSSCSTGLGDRAAAGVPGRRRRQARHRARHILCGRPLRNAARHMGRIADLSRRCAPSSARQTARSNSPSWMSGSFELGQMAASQTGCGSSPLRSASSCCSCSCSTNRLGLQMRAVTQNRRMASAMGIRTWSTPSPSRSARHCRHRRRGAEPGRQRLARPRPELHHRFLHGRRVRRRRQSVGHAGRRLHVGRRQQVPRALCWRRSPARSSCSC